MTLPCPDIGQPSGDVKPVRNTDTTLHSVRSGRATTPGDLRLSGVLLCDCRDHAEGHQTNILLHIFLHIDFGVG